jgi:hypothetical protein
MTTKPKTTTIEQYELHGLRMLARQHGLGVEVASVSEDGTILTPRGLVPNMIARYAVHGLANGREVSSVLRTADELAEWLRGPHARRRHRGDPYHPKKERP